MALTVTTALDLDAEVENTGFSVAKVLKMIDANEQFGKLAKSQKGCKDISDGKGFCSRVFKTIVHFEEGDTYGFVMKVPTDAFWDDLNLGKPLSIEEKKQNKINVAKMHNCEVDVYEMLGGMAKRLPLPEIYFLEHTTDEFSGVIAMEDLSGRGESLGIYYSATTQQCYNIARHVADLQSYFDFEADKKWKSRFIESMHTSPDVMKIWKRMMYPVLEYDDPELAETVQMFIDIDLLKLAHFALQDYTKQYDANTHAHGDAWTNNMLIKLNEDNVSISDEILAFIDWQTCVNGSPLFDIARFICNCTDGETRRECERKSVDVYYDRLTENYAKFAAKPKFTREQAHEFYDICFAQQVGVLIIMFATIVLPLNNSTKEEDREKMKKLATRIKLAAKDAMPTIEKYEMRTRFAATDNEM
ncbi:hypothetical protein M3Y98_00839700 [Aphelenchoides besseyi]|nr:hypothetical protein M3Y98_00839700 [Aphelenchoides besseyi]